MRKIIQALIIMVCILCAASSPAYASSRLRRPKAAGATEHSITVTWRDPEGGKKYILQWKNTRSGKVKTYIVKTRDYQYTFKKLKAGTPYLIKVAPYAKKPVFSKTLQASTIINTPETPSLAEILEKKTKTKIAWTAIENATSYVVTIKKNGEAVQKAQTEKTRVYIRNAKIGDKYLVIVQPVRTVNGQTAKGKRLKIQWTKEDTSDEALVKQILTNNPYEEDATPSLVYTKQQAEAFANYGNGRQPWESGTNYLIWCNRATYHMFLFRKDALGKWEQFAHTACIIGQDGHPTRVGRYTLRPMEEYHQYSSNYARYVTSYEGDNAIHSLLYPSQADELSTGYKASYGCIRVPLYYAQFIYQNCNGATLVIL